MIQTKNDYVFGTAAKKLQYDVYEENKVLKAKKIKRSNAAVKVRSIAFILFIFALSFIIMYRYTLITDLNYSINKSDKIYNELMNNNSYAKVEIEKDTDLTRIKELAEERLGMQKPDKSQMVYVNVPKDDVTIVSNKYMNAKKTGESMFAVLAEKIGEIVGLLY